MRLSTFVPMSTVTALSSLALSPIAETYSINGAPPFADGNGASTDALPGCKLESKLPNFIRSAPKGGVTVSITKESLDDVDGKVIQKEVRHILGAGGGAWSRPRAVTVHGELRDGHEVTGAFTATRYSTGGAFGGLKGICSILGRCVKTLRSDIAT